MEPSVMSKYHKLDMNEYPNIFGCHIIYQTNILGCHIFTEQISEYIRTLEIAQIRIIFEGKGRVQKKSGKLSTFCG